MTLAVTSPVTGGAQTGFTTPTYTLTTDSAPTTFGRQYAVTTVGGTGNTPRLHAVSDPFTITLSRAAVLRPLQTANPTTGRYGPVPKNVHKIIVRKGVNFAANQAPETMLISTDISVPAGSDAYNPVDVRAAISLFCGALFASSAGIGDTCVTGVP
jgi:hypothetical protein